MKLLIATRNSHKYQEILHLFSLPQIELVCPNDIPDLPVIREDGKTFQINAVKKAVTLALATKLWTLADDSGLEVAALNGAPGICSARYAGDSANPAANNAKLLNSLKNKQNRSARFYCIIALSSPVGRVQTVDGICKGFIINEERGSSGFGYDPVFVPEGYSRTFSQLGTEVKNRISHRAIALKRAFELWGNMLIQQANDWCVND